MESGAEFSFGSLVTGSCLEAIISERKENADMVQIRVKHDRKKK